MAPRAWLLLFAAMLPVIFGKVGEDNSANISDIYLDQGGITCGAIDEPTKSSKAIDERVIINFRDKNVVIARFLRMFGLFAIDEILRYRGTQFPLFMPP